MAPEPKVTIAIPTYNRSELLKTSIKSILVQDYPNFQILVLDNASTDDTVEVVHSFIDSRIRYVRSEINLGAFRNWNRAIELNNNPYLSILSDDDVLLPGFIRESVLALDNVPHAAFSAAQTQFIDIHGAPLQVTGMELSDPLPPGLINGLEFIHQIVDGRKWILRTSAVMFRASALAVVGAFDIPHSKYMNDLNLYLRLAQKFDVIFIPQELAQVRFHHQQDSQTSFHGGTGPLAVMAERTDGIAYLLQSARSEDPSYRQWLAERLLHLSMRRSEMTSQFLSGLNLTWEERLQIAIQDITDSIPTGESVILVDENQWDAKALSEFRLIPFLECNGQYWGSPPDDRTAIHELERMRQGGTNFIVFIWSTFWWLDYYLGLRDYLKTNFHCVLHNSRVIIFDL
jgi:hypothetical protein